MNWFETIKDFYDSGLYDKNDVRLFVTKGKITPEQYKEITGEAF